MIAHPPKRKCSSELSPRVGENRTDDAMTKLSYAELDKETIAKAYARWAPVYDVVFGAVFERGRQAAIAAAERIGGRILQVGGGAGIFLPGYLRGHSPFGGDISAPEVCQGHQRGGQLGLSQVQR